MTTKLRDKLFSMSNQIKELEAIVNGIENPLEVTVLYNNNKILINPFADNNVSVPNYTANQNVYPGQDSITNKWKYAQFKIRIQNVSKYPVRLYSLFRGPGSQQFTHAIRGIGNITDYYTDLGSGLYATPYFYIVGESALKPQQMNQIVYFRAIDAYNANTVYYTNNMPTTGIDAYNTLSSNNILYGFYDESDSNFSIVPGFVKYTGTEDETVTNRTPIVESISGNIGAMVYPIINSFDDISIPTNTNQNYFKLNEGEYIDIPINFDYSMGSGLGAAFISKTISFDIKYSLYQEANNYKIKFTASNFMSPQDLSIQTTNANSSTYNSVIGGNQFSIR